MTKTVVTLSDKYTQTEGQVFLSSLQALVRLPLDQVRGDRAAALRTGGYVTGYRGSPITTLDAQLWAAKALLTEHDVHFEPGLNEELAATSLRGTQELDWFGRSRFQGVSAMWYAKGLGVDRAVEALKLGNFEGAAANGGVLVVAGDDHAAKSSASAHQSEHTLIAGLLPILYPATTDEILRYGLHGWAMSRHSGAYVGLKTITDTLDLTSTVTLPAIDVVRPPLDARTPLNIQRGLSALQQEALLIEHRLPAAQAYARANRLDTVPLDGERRVLTIVTAGKAYLDVRQTLRDLGLDEARCRAIGLRIVKLALIWPLDADFARTACAGSREVLVVEEKRPLIEEQLTAAFYALPADLRPALSGKRDPAGAPLLSSVGVLDPNRVRHALLARLAALGLLDAEVRGRADRLAALEAQGAELTLIASRPAFFCSGCPHNTSTVLPEGSMALGATGCHGLAAFMPERRTTGPVGMGSEGMPWVGAQHFTDMPHMFQNMGDGTFTHSGLLSIRAAVAAQANVTFKLLFNDAVAMTGGQPMEGGTTAERIAQTLHVEGVRPVVLVSEQPERFAPSDLPPATRILHRDHLDEIQRELRDTKGVTAIVYDQTCANEKRRRRKRGAHPDPDMRLWINPAVCEGCGDCSRQSNCMSVTPLETEFGRKRLIDQSTCNKDYSCVKGYCPSFVTVRGATIAKRQADPAELDARIAALPAPAVAPLGPDGFSLMVTGIGGTGVLTVGAVLGMAAHLEGRAAKVLDMTGMAQKGGAVTSHIRIADTLAAIPGARLGTGQADLLVACDLIVASAPDVLAVVDDATRIVANDDIVPTGEFQTNARLDLSRARFLSAIAKRAAADRIATVAASSAATKLIGDSIFTNLLMVGFAAQRGLMPLSLGAIEAAIRLNGVAVKANLLALGLGRLAAADPGAVRALMGEEEGTGSHPETLAEMIASRTAHLTAYQDAAYADRYRAFLGEIAAVLAGRGIAEADGFVFAVAEQYARTLAYKDEYEVARLYTDPKFTAGLRAQFGGDYTLALNLGSPLLSRRIDPRTGRPQKVELPARVVLPLFRLLARGKRLRGTRLDPFGRQAERRFERALIGEYEALIREVAGEVTPRTLPIAVEIAAAAGLISGYGPVKDAGYEVYRKRVDALLVQMREAPAPEPALAA